MTRTLGFWVARRYGTALVAVLALLVTLITVVSLVEASQTLLTHAAPWHVAALLAGCTAVEYAHLLFPVAVLLALVVVGTAIARSGELAGLQAQGLATWALAAPFAIVAVVATALACLSSELVLPRAAALRRTLMAQELRRVDPATLYFQARSTWHRDGDWVLHLPELDADAHAFVRPTAYRLAQGRVVQVLYAQALQHDSAQGWRLTDVMAHTLDGPQAAHLVSLALPLRATPTALMQHMGNPRELRGSAAHALIARRRMSGLDTTLHHIELLQRFTYPWSGPLLLLVGLPWALNPNRRRALAGMLCACVACVAWVLVGAQVLRLLALAHRLPVGVGATAPLGLAAGLAVASAWARRVGWRRHS